MNAAFEWAPVLPAGYVAALGAGAFILFILAWLRGRDFVWRAGFFLVLAAMVMNPVVRHELREALPDKAIVVVDESASQKIGGRDKVAEEALAHVKAFLEKMGVEPIVIRAGAGKEAGKGEGTRLFAALRDALPGIPAGQVAGTVLITDGQVHDAPDAPGALESLGPFHAVLTGKRDEFDRKVSVVSAPRYGLLGQEIRVVVRVDEFGRASGADIPLRVAQLGGTAAEAVVAAGEERAFTFTLEHPGQNVFEFSVPEAAGELTGANNSVPVIVNAVRDRLRVLLVSGSPHMGERAWRNLLKSDPSIDLVHFTILRSAASIDAASPDELSLIVFPVEELFQRKLREFDLVIFDRYTQVSLLTQLYFNNIAAYVERGGAFLMAMSTDGEEEASVFDTALAGIVPVAPRGGIAEGEFVPAVTEAGAAHPVTADVQRVHGGKWGAWLAQAGVERKSGEVLMTGARGLPLLVVDKVGEGRVAALASDNIWLWSKGASTRGPYTQLLRNTAHWLMKEPELEDDYIRAEARGSVISVSQRDLGKGARAVEMTAPSGEKAQVGLVPSGNGWVSAEVQAEEMGVYSFAAGARKTFVVVGTARNEEFADVHATGDRLKGVVRAGGGGVVWFAEEPGFAFRAQPAGARDFAGRGWLGLKENRAYAVKRSESRELVPDAGVLLLVLGGLLLVWRRESGV